MTIERNQNVVWENRVDGPYWEGLKAGEIRVQRCDKCQTWIWPAEWRCGTCGSWDLHWETVPNEGVIYAWTRTHYAFAKRFADMMPFITVLVQLPKGGGHKVVGILEGPSEGVKIGAKVTPVFKAPSDHTMNLPGLWWRLADGQ